MAANTTRLHGSFSCNGNATFHLLQATQLNNVSWTTNAAAVFTTNVLNNSYLFTATNNSTLRFYRVQTP
jgi:hypothetical protein